MSDRFRLDASLRRIAPTSTDRIAGKRADRLVIDDPHAVVAALFEDRGPIAHVGRNSIPRSHRGEGVNFVD